MKPFSVIRLRFLVAFCVVMLNLSCTLGQNLGKGEVVTRLELLAEVLPSTKSDSPQENLITDVNVFVYNSAGLLDKFIYLDKRHDEGELCCDVSLLEGSWYSIYVCANMGFRMGKKTIQELRDFRFYLAYPDDYRIGVPMSGHAEVKIASGVPVTVPLERAMAKISVRVDRSALDDDVVFTVTRLEVCNCPRSVLMFGDNALEDDHGGFDVGFFKDEIQTSVLNLSQYGRISGEADLYVFENLQGEPLGELDSWDEKVFEVGDVLGRRCSYLELHADYISDEYETEAGKSLIYRTYLGDSPSDFNLRRNCHYHITIRPEGDGLPQCRWRVDRSGLRYCGPTWLRVEPHGYIRGKIGDKIHIRCDWYPSFAPPDLGEEFMEEDRKSGIYDYVIDDDCHGVTLTLTGPGSGYILMGAGPPVDDWEGIVIEVDLPTDSDGGRSP